MLVLSTDLELGTFCVVQHGREVEVGAVCSFAAIQQRNRTKNCYECTWNVDKIIVLMILSTHTTVSMLKLY